MSSRRGPAPSVIPTPSLRISRMPSICLSHSCCLAMIKVAPGGKDAWAALLLTLEHSLLPATTQRLIELDKGKPLVQLCVNKV